MDTKWMTTNTPIMTTLIVSTNLTVYKLVFVVDVTEKKGGWEWGQWGIEPERALD